MAAEGQNMMDAIMATSNRGVQGALGMQVSKHRSSRCEHGMVTSTLEHVASTHRQLKVRYGNNNMWMLM